MDWGQMTYGEMVSQLNGSTAYKFEVTEGKVQLKVDGLMGSLKRSSVGKQKKIVPKTASKKSRARKSRK